MQFKYTHTLFFLLITFLFSQSLVFGQNKNQTTISGNLFLDDSWDSVVYLSYIPTFDDMYLMSNDMIIAQTAIDSTGHFEFDINFLPPENKLYRLHIIKKGDSPTSLIIGGRNENHLFLLANNQSKITVSTSFSYPPFKNVLFKNSQENRYFQQIRNIVLIRENSFSDNSVAKRELIEKNIEKDLLAIADTSSFPLVSLFAIYESDFERNYASNVVFYNAYFKKWKNIDNKYFRSLKKQLPIQQNSKIAALIFILLFLTLLILLILFKKKEFNQKRNFKNLSLQERKIFELLRKGATNQEISDQCLISISTVKSHVSNIYSKLNIKSRKDIMNLEL